MKLNKIDIACSKYFSQFFWVSLILVGFHEFGQPIFSAAVEASSSSVTTAPYVRKSRDTFGLSPTSAPENSDGQEQYGHSPSRSGFFQYPSFKHKYQTRMSRFHGDSPPSSISIRSLTTFPKLNPLAGLLSGKSGEVLPSNTGRKQAMEDLFQGEGQDPTFTPYISARALSNIPQFFQHLRDNLEALQLDDDEDESDSSNSNTMGQSDGMFIYGNDDEGRPITIPHPQENKNMRWMPLTAGMTGRAHVRHFVNDPAEQDLFYRKPALYNPSRNAYEFGLG